MYIRQLQSPAHICFTGSNSEESLDLIQNTAHEMCDRWLSWVSQADPFPEAHQEQLAERDLNMRQMSAEQDPGNAAIARMLGEDFTDKLVKALWQKEPVNL